MMRRLGYLNVVNLLDADMHYILRLERPDEREMMRRLVRVAVRSYLPGEPNILNLQINGRPVKFAEDGKLWTLLTDNSENPTNVIEFDFKATPELRRNAAVAYVQSHWRRVLLSERWNERILRTDAAVFIQRWWRVVLMWIVEKRNRPQEEHDEEGEEAEKEEEVSDL